MRKFIAVMAAVPMLALVAAASEVPKTETFLGYNYVRFNPNSDVFPSFNANGGGGQFVYNFNKWVGGVVDVGAVTRGSFDNFNVDATVINFVAGPRITYHNHSRFVRPARNRSAFTGDGSCECFQYGVRDDGGRRPGHQGIKAHRAAADWCGLLPDPYPESINGRHQQSK